MAAFEEYELQFAVEPVAEMVHSNSSEISVTERTTDTSCETTQAVGEVVTNRMLILSRAKHAVYGEFVNTDPGDV